MDNQNKRLTKLALFTLPVCELWSTFRDNLSMTLYKVQLAQCRNKVTANVTKLS